MSMSLAHRSQRGETLLRLALLAAGLGVSAASDAAWEVVPDVSMGMVANDNPRLRSFTAHDTSSAELDAQVTLSSFGERGNLYIRPRVRSSSYADAQDSELESTDYYFRSLGEYQWTSATAGFSGNYSRVSIRNAALLQVIPQDPDVPDPIESDTGQLSFLSENRHEFYIQPYVEFNLSERTGLRLETRHVNVQYSGLDSPDFGRTDFTQNQVLAGLVRRVDERNRVTAQVLVSKYEADRNDNVTDTVGVQGIFSRTLSTTWTMNLTAGVERSDYSYLSDIGTVKNADTNFAFDVGLRKRTELMTLNLDFRKAVDPNSVGYLVTRNEIRTYIRRRLSERVALLGGIRLSQTATLAEANRAADRDFYRANLSGEWAMTQQWYLTVGYNYTSLKFPNVQTNNRDANANEFRLEFNYRGLSRQ
jgi:hypothetical protein